MNELGNNSILPQPLPPVSGQTPLNQPTPKTTDQADQKASSVSNVLKNETTSVSLSTEISATSKPEGEAAKVSERISEVAEKVLYPTLTASKSEKKQFIAAMKSELAHLKEEIQKQGNPSPKLNQTNIGRLEAALNQYEKADKNVQTELRLLEAFSAFYKFIDQHPKTPEARADMDIVRLLGEVAAKKLEACQQELETLKEKPGITKSEILTAEKKVIDAERALNQHVLKELKLRNPDWKNTRDSINNGHFEDLFPESVDNNLQMELLESSIAQFTVKLKAISEKISTEAENDVNALMSEILPQTPDAVSAENVDLSPEPLSQAQEKEIDDYLSENVDLSPEPLSQTQEKEIDDYLSENETIDELLRDAANLPDLEPAGDIHFEPDSNLAALQKELEGNEDLSPDQSVEDLLNEVKNFPDLEPAGDRNVEPDLSLAELQNELEEPTTSSAAMTPPAMPLANPLIKPFVPLTAEQKTIAQLNDLTKKLNEAALNHQKLRLYQGRNQAEVIAPNSSLTQRLTSKLGSVGKKMQEHLLGRSKASEQAMTFIASVALNALIGPNSTNPAVAKAVEDLLKAIEDNPWAQSELKRDPTNTENIRLTQETIQRVKISGITKVSEELAQANPAIAALEKNMLALAELVKKHPSPAAMDKYNSLTVQFQKLVETASNLSPGDPARQESLREGLETLNADLLVTENSILTEVERSVKREIEKAKIILQDVIGVIGQIQENGTKKLILQDGELVVADRGSSGSGAGKSEQSKNTQQYLLDLCRQYGDHPVLKEQIDKILSELKKNAWFQETLMNNPEIKLGFESLWPKLELEGVLKKLQEVNSPESRKKLEVDENGNVEVVSRNRIGSKEKAGSSEKAQGAIESIIATCERLVGQPNCNAVLNQIVEELKRDGSWPKAALRNADETVKARFEALENQLKTPAQKSTKKLEATLFGPPANPEFKRQFLSGGYRSVAKDLPASPLLAEFPAPNDSQRLLAYLSDAFKNPQTDLFAKREILTIVQEWVVNPDFHGGDLESAKGLVEGIIQTAKESGSPTLSGRAQGIEAALVKAATASVIPFPPVEEGTESLNDLLAKLASDPPQLERKSAEYKQAVLDFSRSLKLASAEAFSGINPSDLANGASVKVAGSDAKTWPDSILRQSAYCDALAHFITSTIMQFAPELPDNITTLNTEIAQLEADLKEVKEKMNKLPPVSKRTDEEKAESTRLDAKMAEIQKKQKDKNAEHASAIQTHIATLSEEDAQRPQEQTARVYSFFVDVSENLRTPDTDSPITVDYASWKAITAGLDNAAVTRLFGDQNTPTALGSQLGNGVLANIQKDRALGDGKNNSYVLRETVKKGMQNGEVVVPFTGVTNTEVTYSLDGNLSKDEINVKRVELVGNTLGQVTATRNRVAASVAKAANSGNPPVKKYNTAGIFGTAIPYSDKDIYDKSVFLFRTQ